MAAFYPAEESVAKNELAAIKSEKKEGKQLRAQRRRRPLHPEKRSFISALE